MSVRPQTAALIVLLVVMGFVFVLVGEAGVSTQVFKPTPTPAPTEEAAASAGSAENWIEGPPGVLQYQANPQVDARVAYLVAPLDELAAQFGMPAPAPDAAYPLLDLTTAIYEQIMVEVQQLGLTLADESSVPAIRHVRDVPTALMHIAIPSQTLATGEPYPGLEMAYAFVEAGEGEAGVFQYRLGGEPDEAIYQDFLAWLGANAAAIVAPVAQPTAEATEAAEPEVAATEALEPDAATTEAAPVEPTEEPEGEAAALTPSAPEAVSTQAPEQPAVAATGSDWAELAPGQLMYTADPSLLALATYAVMPVEQLVDTSQIADFPADPAEQALAVLEFVRDRQAEQLTAEGVILEEGAFVGPEAIQLGGHDAAMLRIIVGSQVVNEQASPGIVLELVVIPRPDGQVVAVTFRLQGEMNEDVYRSYQAWLAESVDELVTAEAPAQGSAAPLPAVTAEATEAAG